VVTVVGQVSSENGATEPSPTEPGPTEQ